jgi:molecular chaperone DnaK (HSP70)
MFSFQQIRKFFLTIVLTIMMAITIGFDFGHTDSWVSAFRQQVITQPQHPVATMNQADTMTNKMVSKDQVVEKS